MVPQNSLVDFYVGLLTEVMFDNPVCSVSARIIQRDVREVLQRASSEGLGFLTKTLPRLGKALDQGLTSMRLDIPSGFKPAKDAKYPAFLQGHFSRIFDADGCILDNADPLCVAHVRQVCFMFYKLELPFNPLVEQAVLDSFVRTEQELVLPDDPAAPDELVGASYIIRDAFDDFNEKDIEPRHGPGAVATGEKLDEKWAFARFYESIDLVYPYRDYFAVGGDRELQDRPEWLEGLIRPTRGVAKVVLVPKDSRGPRLISAEPLEFQFVQQGLGRKMMAHMEESFLTRGQVNFTSQEVNRELALSASRTEEWATLDLKDASDRVSLWLVRLLFGRLPNLLAALEATRTSATLLPDGRLVELRKFAPMGSALCFPVEAVCFWAICVSAISRATGILPRKAGKMVFVFGDDIIVRTEHTTICTQALERAGLRVNLQKSCVSGKFRESCGMDAYNGVCVTPTRIKTCWSGRHSDGSAFSSYAEAANHLAAKGYVSAADYIWKRMEKVYGRIPFGTCDSPYVSRWVESRELAERLNACRHRTRFSSTLHRFEFQVRFLASQKLESTLDGWPRLLRNVLVPQVGSDPSVVVVPRSTKIKRGWMAV